MVTALRASRVDDDQARGLGGNDYRGTGGRDEQHKSDKPALRQERLRLFQVDRVEAF